MIVSFDLDDTLFVSPSRFKTEEELGFPWNKIYKERLRYGTKALIEKLHNHGIQVWIYTTSFRSERYIRRLFRHYGIKLDQVINGDRHQREVQGDKRDPMPSKFPSKYRIDLHIDDDKSVLQNGRTYGFKVLIIGPPDDMWADKIWEEVERIITVRAKELYLMNAANFFNMKMNGEYDEYIKYNVPKDIELKWSRECMNQLAEKIRTGEDIWEVEGLANVNIDEKEILECFYKLADVPHVNDIIYVLKRQKKWIPPQLYDKIVEILSQSRM